MVLFYLLAYLVVLLTGITGPREVTLLLDGESQTLYTYRTQVGEILAEAGVELREEDRVLPGRHGWPDRDGTITVQRAFPVHLKVGGEMQTLYSPGESLADLARRAEIALGPFDQPVLSWKAAVAPGQVVEILRVQVEEEVQLVEVEPRLELRPDPSLPQGMTRVESEGEAGRAARVFQVTRVNNWEEARELVRVRTLVEAQPKIILHGTGPRGARVARDSLRVGDTWQGRASWYGGDGDGFHGRRTANGEIFDSNAMTAAHPFLPFGTRVMVTHVSSGREVIVRINDRGPFIGARIIDLSRAAAEVLNMRYAGVAEVKVAVLSLP